MKRKNNIYKFHTDHYRRPKEVGGEGQLQNEALKEIDRERMQWRLITAAILETIIGTVGFITLIIVSYKAGKIWGFLDVYGDLIHDYWVLLPFELSVGIYGAYKRKKTLRQVAITVFLATLFLPMPISALKWGKIYPDRYTEGLALEEIGSAAIPVSTEVSEPEVVYPKERYFRDDDIFVEKLELYCGVEIGAIAEEYVAEKRADILAKDIETNKKIREGKTKSQLFWDNWHRADYMFRVYSKQRDIYNDDKNTSLKDDDKYLEDICNYRLSDLDEAIRYRILADEQYEDAENQKLLAQYFIGLADEYISQESYSLASENLQEGAKWAAKSIYNAIIEGDKNKMWKGMTELDNVINRLEKMGDTINKDVISTVKDGRDAYRVLIERQ